MEEFFQKNERKILWKNTGEGKRKPGTGSVGLIDLGSTIIINIKPTAEEQGNLESIRGISIAECKYKECFRKLEEYFIAEDQ